MPNASFLESTQGPLRLRRSPALRAMVRETCVNIEDLIYPLFLSAQSSGTAEITALPGLSRFSLSALAAEIDEVVALGIGAVLLFALPREKDKQGKESYAHNGVVQEAVRFIKHRHPGLVVITDVCLCAYTTDGHCSVLTEVGDGFDWPKTLSILQKISLSHAAAGADIVAPSGMVDGMVAAIRSALDANGFSAVSVMSYAVKYASAFYGPFREATGCAPKFGDRKSYQMDSANVREAVREAQLDVNEGADFLMVKPALAYLDILKTLRERFDLPLVAYNVSGEYAMVKAAAAKGWINEPMIVDEILLGIKRAGADLIITYFAKEFAARLKSDEGNK